MSGKDGPNTRLTRLGRAEKESGLVNPPVARASTVLARNAKELYGAPPGRRFYGRFGMETQDALKDAVTALQGGAGTSLVSSGLMSMTMAVTALVEAGGEVLAVDCLYGPVRSFLKDVLPRHGVSVRFIDPEIGVEIGDLITPDTQAICLESPGSLSFEMQDLPAIARIAQDKGVPTVIDDTWSAGLTMKPMEIGIDIAAQALTKYVGGHSDLLLGAITSRTESLANRVKRCIRAHGVYTSPEESALALRGLRTLNLRMTHSAQTSLEIARWLAERPETGLIRHPALPGAPGHERWKTSFTGAAGVFGVEFPGWDIPTAERFLDALKIFGLGFSWGGFESLAIHADPQLRREAGGRAHEGVLMRFAIGLEDAPDLIADLEAALQAVETASAG
jgi:cystathionine beta-lyase